MNLMAISKSLAILPKIGGTFSIVGSSLLLRDIGRKWEKVPLTTEVMAHITIANLCYAFWNCFLSTWMVPKGSPAVFATGNTATCNVQGFIATTMFIILEMSYTILSVLYWIVVAYGWTEQKTQRLKIRFFFLGLPIIVAVGISTSLLFLRMFNFDGAYSCGIEEYPLNCDIEPEKVCERGGRAHIWQVGLMVGILVFTVIIIVSMSLLVKDVRTQERKSDKYLTKGQEKRRELTRKTFWQAIRYFLVYFVSHLPFYAFAIFDLMREPIPPAAALLYATVWPMFGGA